MEWGTVMGHNRWHLSISSVDFANVHTFCVDHHRKNWWTTLCSIKMEENGQESCGHYFQIIHDKTQTKNTYERIVQCFIHLSCSVFWLSILGFLFFILIHSALIYPITICIQLNVRVSGFSWTLRVRNDFFFFNEIKDLFTLIVCFEMLTTSTVQNVTSLLKWDSCARVHSCDINWHQGIIVSFLFLFLFNAIVKSTIDMREKPFKEEKRKKNTARQTMIQQELYHIVPWSYFDMVIPFSACSMGACVDVCSFFFRVISARMKKSHIEWN